MDTISSGRLCNRSIIVSTCAIGARHAMTSFVRSSSSSSLTSSSSPSANVDTHTESNMLTNVRHHTGDRQTAQDNSADLAGGSGATSLHRSPEGCATTSSSICGLIGGNSRPKSLMESLLVAKMEHVAVGGVNNSLVRGRTLVRTDSVDSASSMGSIGSSLSSDVCRCDDCLLGIADLYAQNLDTDVKLRKKPSGWRKLRNIVQWTPFFQTYKKQRYPWVQLAGHQGNFKAGPDQGTILKKLCEKEEKCFRLLMKDLLRPYVPEFKGLVTSDDGECSYLQLQDLLGDFQSPCVMDCKIGVRTYLEEELAKAKEKPKLRKDMYEKMCQIDADAPTEEEHRLKGVTKPRYMVWRETISSTETLGFRIEGIRRAEGTSSKDFKTTKTKENVLNAFLDFTKGFPHAVPKYIQRLKAIKATLEASPFFRSHEVIGSSLLFVHDRFNANVWLIDFAKTVRLPDEMHIDHKSKWKVGNHEDGYLIGIDNIISIFLQVIEQQPISLTPPPITMPSDVHDTDGVYDAECKMSLHSTSSSPDCDTKMTQ